MAETSSKSSLTELTKRKEEIEILLASLEDEYREATVSEKSYNEIKKKNIEKLEEIKKEIEEMKKNTEAQALAPIPESVKKTSAPFASPQVLVAQAPANSGKVLEDVRLVQT